jgi:hypothetical protein
MILNRVEGKRLVTMDGQPAGRIYDQYLGIETEAGSVSERAREFPLIINRHGLEISRIAAYRLPDGSLAFPSDIQEGEQAQFIVANVEMMLENARGMVEELSCHPIEASFIFSCTVRRGVLQSAADQETLPLRNVGAVAGFYTYGEYFHHPQCNQVLNGAMSVVGLSEKATVATSSGSSRTSLRRRLTALKIPASVRVFATMSNLIRAVHSPEESSEEATASEKFLDIIAVEAEGNYTRAYLREAQPLLIRLTMKKWETVLPKQLFVKLHRALIIQIRQIEHWEMQTRETGHLHLCGIKQPIPLSRHSVRLLRKLER